MNSERGLWYGGRCSSACHFGIESESSDLNSNKISEALQVPRMCWICCAVSKTSVALYSVVYDVIGDVLPQLTN